MSASENRTWLEHYPEWTDPHLDYGDDTLNDVYAKTVKEYPDRPALRFFGRAWTYAELDEQVRRAAAGLRSLGVSRGDHVALVMPNCPQHAIAYWAVLRLGAVVIEHNPLYTAHELRHPFHDHGARVAICWDKAVPVLEELRDDAPLETIVAVNMLLDLPWLMRTALKLPVGPLKASREKLHSPAPNVMGFDEVLGDDVGGDGRDLEPAEDVTTDDVAVIMYTSGTTGTPKGAQLTHGSLVANIIMGRAWVPGLGEEREVVLGVLPMFHAYGLTIANNLSMLIGGEMVLVPAAEMDLIMKVMKSNRPTWVPGVPTLYEKIIATAEEKHIDLEGVKFSFCGAATLPVSTVEKWERLTGGRLVEGYGLTETSPIIVGNPMDGNRRPGYVGIPFPDTDLAVVDPEEPTRRVADGEEGEVIVRGPQVFAGYLNRPEDTEAGFTDGPDGAEGGRWYRTGDVGVLEDDGFLRLVARIKEVIITGGFNVYPAEVEEVLTDLDEIVDATVVGLPKADGSELVVAAVALADYANLDVDSYRAHARENLTGYKVPRAYFHLDEMPRDQMGKVRRRDVRDVLMKQLEDSGRTVDSLIKRH
ncbi:long-chain-fatty-acid--CoA ligase [uncultured Corynebacterium sp.]|uniref:long-chain-fatty-acid--CoA ligase n=1 Tax=uncultured Corynebacterium sp. TaxID=159447 RepID=UPI0025E7ABE1|nr:long-chain-fatty-acid--CoA ligase [uncultured Corynebacterium sp.]